MDPEVGRGELSVDRTGSTAGEHHCRIAGELVVVCSGAHVTPCAAGCVSVLFGFRVQVFDVRILV